MSIGSMGDSESDAISFKFNTWKMLIIEIQQWRLNNSSGIKWRRCMTSSYRSWGGLPWQRRSNLKQTLWRLQPFPRNIPTQRLKMRQIPSPSNPPMIGSHWIGIGWPRRPLDGVETPHRSDLTDGNDRDGSNNKKKTQKSKRNTFKRRNEN